ncbi:MULTISPECIES: RagB/SusD family nutrient uptake outer membrane protein [Bacteroides]|jgi:hypothetical protein|uniref:RagB/SusD family nutrient uptake outer membrane protein n=1 Tax=Bacteroides TaxID=816 RepID=UPI000C79249C|nr:MULTISPECIES: RagB/SusD family nutrient uptake outer membrane protein [Bacteroides]RGM48800.1 RagB/SusD family nutrient uptake outer membrane protein [Bacteroides sp. OM08-11]
MKKILISFLTVAFGLSVVTSCIEEVNPQSSTVTKDQAANAPGSYNNFVSGLTSSLVGKFKFGSDKPFDFGYPTFYQMRDVMGQDVVPSWDGHWYQTWYTSGTALGPQYLYCQVPWTYYYGWIKNCNTVLSLAGTEPDADKATGAGIAYAMRAMFYMDLARMFAQNTYALDKNAETVPIVTESTALSDLANNPRATNEKMWGFILSDLDNAEKYLADYERPDKYTPDLSVVYGLKARAYQVMEDWVNAEKYAKLAQKGYTLMNEEDYTSRETGFNTPNSSWMFGLTYKANDDNILLNDGDSSWGSFMCLEVNGSECGYASSYGSKLLIDRHLYETIPAGDFRKKCFVDFKIDELGSKAEQVEALKAYSDYPEWVYNSGHKEGTVVGGLSLKFRAAGGSEGHYNQYKGFLVAVPIMRVEEMYLIEAEAAGMQNEANGIALLTQFAKTRDASYEYGKHNEAYGNQSTSAFQNEIWWQRRIEFWGEGLATFDIKRLNKGIIRSYPNTNHLETRRWNTTEPPVWMDFCIVQSETNYNLACTNNPTPIPPTSDSEEITSW